MKTTLIVIQNEADHADAKKLIEKLMGSGDSQDRATDGSSGSLGRGLRAHAVAAYGTITSSSSRLLDGSTQPCARRSRAVTWNGQPR